MDNYSESTDLHEDDTCTTLSEKINKGALFFLLLAGYYFLSVFTQLLDLLFMKLFVYSSWSSLLISILTIALEIGMIGTYIYFKMSLAGKGRLSGLIDIWGITIILLKVVNFFISGSSIERQYFALWCLIGGITICLMSSAFILKSVHITVMTIIFITLSLISLTIRAFTFDIPRGMKVTINMNMDYMYLLIGFACVGMYFLLEKGKRLKTKIKFS